MNGVAVRFQLAREMWREPDGGEHIMASGTPDNPGENPEENNAGRPVGDDTARPAGKPDLAAAARLVLRAARVGTLATVDDGQPFASLVTPATAPDLSVLMLLSELSEHTRHLRRDAKCALLAAGEAADENPQTTPRVTVTGVAETIVDAKLKARWLGRHPYAAMYADFADFSLWRVRITGALFVGGFGLARRMRAVDLLPPAAAVAAIAAAEADILARVNAEHAGVLDTIARAAGGSGTGWRLMALDTDGADFARASQTDAALADQSVRVPWTMPVASPADVRSALISLADAAPAA